MDFLAIIKNLLRIRLLDFRPPGQAERLQAIGPTEGLPRVLQCALDPSSEFDPIPIPKSRDWLAVHAESGQNFQDFVVGKWTRPNKIRNIIYLQPLREIPEDWGFSVETMKEYVAIYFAMKVEILPPRSALSGTRFTTRMKSGHRQILTTDVLFVLQMMLPADAFCILAITVEDLYPGPSWNFVFGQADLRERVGIYSFARYDPAFYGKKRGKEYQKILLERSCKILIHEIAHMFGLKHCIFFKCILNGSNHLEESDASPLHLCPVCLRKLQFSNGFDVREHYRNLAIFYQKVGLDVEAQWVSKRLQRIFECEEVPPL